MKMLPLAGATKLQDPLGTILSMTRTRMDKG